MCTRDHTRRESRWKSVDGPLESARLHGLAATWSKTNQGQAGRSAWSSIFRSWGSDWLFGTVTEDMVGNRLVVHVGAPAGESVSLRLVGQLKNLSPGRLGGVRAGLEFVDLSETEREILKAMELLKVAW